MEEKKKNKTGFYVTAAFVTMGLVALVLNQGLIGIVLVAVGVLVGAAINKNGS